MNDFVKVGGYATGTPDFSKIPVFSHYSRGEQSWINYKILKGYKPIKLKLNESSGIIELEGNLGFFWHGHNLNFTTQDFDCSFNYLSDLFQIDFYKMKVHEFDHSALVKVNFKPAEIINNHISISRHQKLAFKDGIYFEQPRVQVVKMYDAGKRMKKMYSVKFREMIMEKHGISSTDNLIRFEKKYLYPEAYFKSNFTIEDFLKDDIVNLLNDDLLQTYKSIMKTGLLNLPEKKRDINCSTLPLLLGKELGEIHNFNFEALLMQMINGIPSLTKHDRKARKKNIKNNIRKITKAKESKYDISAAISESLEKCS